MSDARFDHPELDLRGKIVAVVAGDEREQEIARLAATTGAEVRGYGFPLPEGGGIDGVAIVDSAREALEGAHFGLFPIPGMGDDGSLFAPDAPGPIVPDAALLSAMAPGAQVILGTPDEALREAASERGIGLHPYEGDTELMLLRMPAIVEAAVRTVVEHTRITIHGAGVCIVGHGNVGVMLCRTMVLLGARVTVAARSAEQRASAYTIGAAGVHTDELAEIAPEVEILLSTVPVPLVDREVIARLPAHAFVADLSAPPGGVDLDHARERGLAAVWARGLGRRAPITVGASQWKGIAERIAGILENER